MTAIEGDRKKRDMEHFEEEIIEGLVSNTGLTPGEIKEMLEVPDKQEFGNFSFPCFRLAKITGQSADKAAQSLSQKLHLNEVRKIEAVGPYINFFIDKESLARSVISEILMKREKYGRSDEGGGKTIVIDFSSVNIAKPFHIGHLKSTVIGNSLYRILSSLGYRCIGINHLGDWGTQFGKLIVAYRKWHPADRDCSVRDLVGLYVRFHREAEKDDSLDIQAREAFKRLENGSEDHVSLWKKFREISLEEFKKTYRLLGVEFDFYQGESFYNDKVDEVIASLDEKGALEISEGALIVRLEEFGLPPCLVRRSDGASLYATRDLAAIMYRKERFDFYKALYVVGNSQRLHFQQIFKVIERMGFPWVSDLIHVDFGLVSLPEGAMSTRKGVVVYLEDVLVEAISKSAEILQDRKLTTQDQGALARQVGVGAVIFSALSVGRQADSIFSWEKVLNFEGDSCPYIQYTCVRIRSLARKSGYVPTGQEDFSLLVSEEESCLLSFLARFPEAIKEAAAKYEPAAIARHVLETAKAFNRFYHRHQIIEARNLRLQSVRLSLCLATGQVIESGLALLGISCPEKM